jgi:uncharacterized membrane protein required for colicin V production
LNPVDITFGFVLVFAMLRGYAKGLLGTAASYVAPVVAFMVAADWSDPVRDRLAAAMPAPDFALDILAPLIVFVVVVATVRVGAAFFARLLGVGLSVPSRILAAAAGATVSALVLGSVVLVVREMCPDRDPPVASAGDDAGAVLASPFERAILDLDRRFSESMLASPLAELASAVVSEALLRQDKSPLLQREEVEAAARKAADAAAAAAVGKLAPGAPARQRSDGDGGSAR